MHTHAEPQYIHITFYLLFLVAAKFKVFATLDWQLFAELAFCALHLQHYLLCRLRLHAH